jgi:hypothetical protein
VSDTIERFIPAPDMRLAQEIIVHAPAALVFDVAKRFQMDSIAAVRAIFWLRARLLGARYEQMHKGLVEAMLGMGWVMLADTPDRELVMGSVTQPWVGEVHFRAIDAGSWAAFAEPGFVKIAWTLESEPIGPELTRFRTETRAQATDESAQEKFRAYRRKFGIGMLMIRWLTLPAMKKAVERLYQAQRSSLGPRGER